MKKILFILIILVNISIGISQNLILNPGFDTILQCPTGALLNGDSNGLYKIAPPWFKPPQLGRSVSPDIYNKCAAPEAYGVPVNLRISYQKPLSGDGYAGIATNPNGGREYLSTTLSKELRKNTYYYVCFYASPLSFPKAYGYVMTYSDAIGLVFSKDTIPPDEKQRLITQESVGNPKGKLIKDTISWTKISGCYKAKGVERYATIGNFRPSSDVTVELEDPVSSNGGTYHYVEDVSVVEFNPLPDSTVLVCIGEAQKYNAAFPSATAYKWNTGSTDSIINITKSGVYSVEVSIDNCVLTDTVVVIVPPDAQKKPPILRGDTMLCEGKRIDLSAASIYGQYTWSTGAKTPSITVSKTNNYAVTVTNRCGIYDDAALITFKKCDCKTFVPTAFSPNGDGVNDELDVYFGCDFDYKVKRFQIYNRWGNLVFRTENTNVIKWNGQMNNQKLPPDVYVWFLEYEYIEDGETKKVVKSGDFTIIY
jgi:gliding motility-associated-like protein